MIEANEGRARGQVGLLIFSWLLVGIPLAWGVVQTLKKAALLFK